MFSVYSPPEFYGSHYDVGYQHAEWWLNYLNQPSCVDYYAYYRSYLKRSWKSCFSPLLNNTEEYAPKVINEIHGMADSLNANGFKTSYLNVFANCLGETGYKGSQCTAFVARRGGGIYLGHNEEEDEVCPLCVSRVNLQVKGRVKSFLSASYPFQLFGSAFGGMNNNLAFQGNSIGYSKYIRQIESSWEERLPKTVFSRMFLECSSLKEILEIYAEWLCSLPSHHFVMIDNVFYSLEVRPLIRYKMYPLHQVNLRELPFGGCHTNHFVKDGVVDKAWTWKRQSDLDQSVERCSKMHAELKGIALDSHSDCLEALSNVAKQYVGKTSASFLVISAGKLKLISNNYFNDTGYTMTI